MLRAPGGFLLPNNASGFMLVVYFVSQQHLCGVEMYCAGCLRKAHAWLEVNFILIGVLVFTLVFLEVRDLLSCIFAAVLVAFITCVLYFHISKMMIYFSPSSCVGDDYE